MSSADAILGPIAVRSWGVKRATVYQRRRPVRTEAYQVVRQNLETWLAQWRVGAPDWVHRRAGAGVADTGTCRRATNCTGNRTGALTTAGDE